MKKSVIAILMTTVILLSLAAPLVSTVSAADPSSWYMTESGVLDSDYYVLYPYETDASLKIGFSKYGELINSDDNVGLEYGAVDPFAPPAGSGTTSQVPKRMWVQGWFLNITYYHRTMGWRNVWAMAIHSDSVVYGNDWIRVDFTNDRVGSNVEDPRDQGYLIGAAGYGSTLVNGGRKTNGTAVTDDIEVLYDGPREFIAVCRTTVYDHPLYLSDSTASDIALVQLAITIRFDKVKKDVVLLKDVKSLLAWKEGEKMKIQFSNRGEVDLGTEETAFGSYAHFWTEGTASGAWGSDAETDLYERGFGTVYDDAWELIQTEDPEDQEFPDYSAAGPFPQPSGATFDYAQAINPDAGYVWSAAFWPSLSDWSIDGWEQWWTSLMAYDPHYIDYRNPTAEPFIPFYIGEWDFVLWHTVDSANRTQFRGVTQYAVTDWHDGDDEELGGENVVDTEMMYYLDQTFNPWDLNQAVHKSTHRWLEWKTSTATTFTTKYAPVVYVSNAEWDDYCTFSERVINMATGKLLKRGVDYSVSYSTSTGKLSFSGLPTAKCKILYSTEDYWEYSGQTTPGSKTYVFEDYELGDKVEIAYDDDYTFAADPLGVVKSWGIDLDMNYVVKTAGNFSLGDPDLDDSKYDFAVDFEDEFEQTYYYWNDIVYETANVNATIQGDGGLMWVEIESPVKDVWISYMDIRLHMNAWCNITTEGEEMNLTITLTPTMNWIQYEWRRGAYEWVTVGRGAATVDSAGSALVAESFDSLKHIEIEMAGSDLEASDAANRMPWVMANFATGTDVAAYKDSLFRAALRDDFCTYWAVASSNMIGVGGPLANLFAYYANDWTDAFYGLEQFAGTAYDNKIVPITCWNRNWPGYTYNTYASSTNTGYAVIATHKDINGTVLFTVWGHWGRDTYYASLWLHGDEARGITPGLLELQRAPAGVTAIILKINYSPNPYHPTYSIPEVLGTISETLWYDQGATDVTNPYKGGIHDP